MTVRIGTRRSPLALQQTRSVADALEALLEASVEIVPVTTRGDVDPAPLASIGGTGVFVSALREKLLDGSIDLAVHSLKDLPTAAAPGLVLAAVPRRADARDALVGAPLAALQPGSRVGTGSPRRAAALHAMGRRLAVLPVRGNIDTRLQLVHDGVLDAVVLATAGLLRLGRDDVPVQPLDPEVMPPAPGQGALAVECREDVAPDLAAALATLDDPASHVCVAAERAALAGLEAGCSAPVGAFAEVVDHQVVLRARVWSGDGTRVITGEARGAPNDPVDLGRRLALDLLGQGANDLISTPTPQPEETAL
jgi:hydroxymethylbilane synthase